MLQQRALPSLAYSVPLLGTLIRFQMNRSGYDQNTYISQNRRLVV